MVPCEFCYYIIHQTALTIGYGNLEGHNVPATEPAVLISMTIIVCKVAYRIARKDKLLGHMLGV